MRRWLSVFLAAFIPQMCVMAYFSWRAQAPRSSQDNQPLVSVSKQGLPPKGTQAATGVAIRVYEGDRMIAEISGTEAQFVGSDSAVFREAVIRAWPDKGQNPRQPDEVFIRADRAEIERSGFTARVTGNVRIDSSDGNHLRAQDLNIRFGKREMGGDGKEVVDHSEKTVDTDGIVELTGDERRLKGRGFHGNLGLKSFRFDHDVEGTFFGTSADFQTTAVSRSSRKPEDVTFSAGGPVTGDPLPPDGNAQRTRLTLAGGVNVLRIDASTEKPSRLRCAVLVLEVRRETTPAPVSLVAWDGAAELYRAMGMTPVRPEPIADVRQAQPKLRLERLTAEGGVVVDDPRVDLVCDSMETTNAADGSGVTTIRGVRKQVVFKERGALSLGPMGGGTGGPEKTGPVEVTAMDDIRIVRSANGEGGTPGPATVSLSRWVSVREGARSLTCDALRIDLTPDPDAKEGAAGYSASALAAKGNVLIEEPGRSARADTLDWDAASDTVTLRSEAGAEVADTKSRLLAKTIAFDNKTGRVTCTGNVVAKGEGGGLAPASLIELNPSSAKGGGKWELHCPAFSGTLSKGELQSLDAEGPVEIVSDSTHAFSDSLHYAEGTAILTGRPARIVAGDDVVEAAEIALSPDSGKAVLRGVKQMRIHLKGGLKGLSGLAPAGRTVPAGVDAVPTPVTLTCTGPVVIDRNAGIFVARDGVLLRAPETAPTPGAPPPPESRLEAERLWIHFEPQTREVLGALATGRVRIRSSGSIAAGDRLTYDVPTGTASLTGVGLASFSGNGLIMRVAEIQVSNGGHTLNFPPRGSKGSISFPDSGSGERRPDDFLRNPFGDLRPKPK